MHVERFEIHGFDGPEPEGMQPGTVSLIALNGRIEVALTAPPRVSPWKTGRNRRILARALEQVLRLPEFRSGQSALSVAPGLLDRAPPPLPAPPEAAAPHAQG